MMKKMKSNGGMRKMMKNMDMKNIDMNSFKDFKM
jgi:hypothetical protein